MTTLVTSCPIPPDDGPVNPRRGSHSARPDYYVQPRIRPSASKIHEMHKGSIGLLFGLDKHQIATGFKAYNSKNHIQMNVMKMREIQKKAREQQTAREVEPATPKPVRPASSSKYQNVQSKVKLNLESTSNVTHKDNFLRAHTRPATAPLPTRSLSETDLSIPLKSSRDVNFVQLNAKTVSKLGKSAPKSHQDVQEKREKESALEAAIQSKKGKVPKYLVDRQEQWQKDRQEKIANRPDPDMPPGHRKMPEEERRQTLAGLEKKRKDLINELQKLPIVIRSQKHTKMKEDIEAQLASVEEAIQIFSRPKVFVQIDQ